MAATEVLIPARKKLSRRDFLKAAAEATGALALAWALGGGTEHTVDPIPVLTSGNYDFWSVAKIEYDLKEKKWKNTVEEGESGYVYGLGDENSGFGVNQTPYKVEGYEFVKESPQGAGVAIYEYKPSQGNQ